MDQRQNLMEIKFECFQTQNWILQTITEEQIDEKMESFVYFHVLFLGYGP